jgi:hypothetical protein
MQAREGEFHGLTSTEICPSGGWRGSAGGPEVLLRERRYHTKFSKSQNSLILFCKTVPKWNKY